MTNSVKAFLYYAPEDEQHAREGLMPHLKILERDRQIKEIFAPHTILPGKIVKEEIERYLNEAEIILLLISANFMSSHDCCEIVLPQAIKQDDLKKAVMIPILLSPVDYQSGPIGNRQVFPRDGRPIISWHNPDAAYSEVSKEIRLVIKKIMPSSHSPINSTFPTKLEDLQQISKRFGHLEHISAVAFSPDDEETLVSGSMDKTIRLWNANIRGAILFKSISGAVTSIAFSPDGKILASGSMDKIVELSNPYTYQRDDILEGHSDGVMSIAFNPKRKILASGSIDKTIKLWDLANKQTIRTLQGHTDTILSIAFSPDGNVIASGSWDRSVRVWDVDSGECLHILKEHSDAVYAVVFSSNGDMLISGSRDKKIRVWNPHTGGKLFMLPKRCSILPGGSSIYSLAMHPDDVQPLLASGHENGYIMLWDLQAEKLLYKFQADSGAIYCLAFSIKGSTLAGGTGGRAEKNPTVSIWGRDKAAP